MQTKTEKEIGGITMLNLKYSKRQNVIRFVASFLIVCMVAVLTMGYISDEVVVNAGSVDEMQAKIDKLEKEQKELSNKIASTQKNVKKEKEKQVLLTSQIKSTEEQLELYRQKIDTVTQNIADKEVEIKGKLADIEVNEEQFAQRVKVMYISNVSNSTLTTLLTAKSFSQFLSNAEILKRISQSDKDLINELSRQQTELADAKLNLEEQKTSLTKTKKDYEAKNNNLASLYQQSTSEEAAQKLAEKKYMEDKAKNKKEIEAIEEEVRKAIEAAGNGGTAPGQLLWPVPSSSRVTSGFGWRSMWGKKEFHQGIDIGEKAGKSIVAAADGEVILVKKSSTGYGWHIVVNHGGGTTTLYAHTSRIDVEVGQKVKQGQTIAGIGTTGASTGNHLHFEVRINNVQKDPMGYVKKP